MNGPEENAANENNIDPDIAEDQLPEWDIDGQVWSPRDILRRIDALETQLQGWRDELAAAREERDELTDELESQRRYIADVDERTDLLRLLDDADNVGADARRVAILQHMWRAVNDAPPAEQRYAMDPGKTEEILHYPEVDRTTILRWMRTTPQEIGDGDVCWYDGGDPGRGGEPARIYLDLRDTDATVPDLVEDITE